MGPRVSPHFLQEIPYKIVSQHMLSQRPNIINFMET